MDEEMSQSIGERLLNQPMLAGIGGLYMRRDAGIADDDEVRRRVEVRRVEAFEDGDAHLSQAGAHGRIDGGVGTAHAVAGLLKQPRQRSHPCAANADQVYVFDGVGQGYERTLEDAQVRVREVGEFFQGS